MSETLRSLARSIFLDALHQTTVSAAVARHLAVCDGILTAGAAAYPFDRYSQVLVVAVGKAGATLFDAVRPLLPETLPVHAVIAAPAPPATLRPGNLYFAGGHPLPNQASLDAGRAALELMRSADERTLVLFLISGGASALLEAPLADSVTLADLHALHRLLIGCGAPVERINSLRKHLSAVKGGRLAARAGNADKLSLLISDVPEGALDALGSGPSLPDTSTVEDALRIVAGPLGGAARLPPALRALVERGLAETPKPGDPAFARSRTVVLLDNPAFVAAARAAAEARGFAVRVDNSCDDRDFIGAADYLLAASERLAQTGGRQCLLSGGEVTVSLPARHGAGGRNQQWALYCAERLHALRLSATVLSAGTDGIDGMSPAAGAVADETTWQRARAAGMNPEAHLAGFDAYPLFNALGDSILTGPSGNNLRDLRMVLVEG